MSARWTEKSAWLAREMWADHCSYSDIAVALGTSRSAVGGFITRCGLQRYDQKTIKARLARRRKNFPVSIYCGPYLLALPAPKPKLLLAAPKVNAAPPVNPEKYPCLERESAIWLQGYVAALIEQGSHDKVEKVLRDMARLQVLHVELGLDKQGMFLRKKDLARR